MAKMIPDRTWPDSDIFIIGGGKSLESFDWSLLRPELTIGCNDAYLHDIEICKIAIFGDYKWWEANKDNLRFFKGRVFTNCNHLQKSTIPWLNVMTRYNRGLVKNGLGWNSNTGASAVNLALILGAKRVFLLGFDCKLTNGDSNWHINDLDEPQKSVYIRFKTGFEQVKNALPKVFPGTEIINVSDVSDLKVFPIIGMEEFWSDRRK
jgi:hypothetical protein